MAEHQEKHTIIGPFPDADPLDTAQLFLRTNGYSVVTSELGERPSKLVVEPPPPSDERAVDEPAADEPDDEEAEPASDPPAEEPPTEEPPTEVTVRLVAERGTKWGGLLSSAMSDLHTTLTVSLVDNSVVLSYVINTTGQILSEDDRAYWGKESSALRAFIKGTDDDVANIVSGEAERARTARRDLLTSGFWIGAVLFVVIFIAGVILFR